MIMNEMRREWMRSRGDLWEEWRMEMGRGCGKEDEDERKEERIWSAKREEGEDCVWV